MNYKNTDDALPSMVGFEIDTLGTGEHQWRSPGYILSDRALNENEYIFAWLIRESDGKIISRVPFKARETKYRYVNKWPKDFIETINALPLTSENTRLLQGGQFENNGALTASPTISYSFHFGTIKPAEKTKIYRLWHRDNGYRLFTSAPFISNQVAALWLPNCDLPAGDSISIQVRDRTTLHLYETHLFTPTAATAQPAETWSKALCEQINEKNFQPDSNYGMLRAGVLASNEITITPEMTNNALWIPQCSDLSVELELTTWQPYASLGTFTPVVGEVIRFFVYDRYCATPLPGSPFSYTITDTNSAKCLAALASALSTSALGRYVKLDGQDNKTLSVMGLPLRITAQGLPSICPVPERALETLDGKSLSLGELYDRFKEGVTLSLNNRSNGHAIYSQAFVPDNASKAIKEAWIKALTAFLSAHFVPHAPLVWSGEWVAPAADAGMQIDKWTLWLPAELEMVLVAAPWVATTIGKRTELPLLDTTVIFLKDKLACEEALIIGATNAEYLYKNGVRLLSGDIIKLGNFDQEIFKSTDYQNGVAEYLNIKEDEKTYWDYFSRLEKISFNARDNLIERKITTNPIILPRLSTANISSLAAARTSQYDIPTEEVELWDIKLPPQLWIETCATCTKQNIKLVAIVKSSLNSDLLDLFDVLKKINSLKKKFKFLTQDINVGRTPQEYQFQYSTTSDEIYRTARDYGRSFYKMTISAAQEFSNLFKKLNITEAKKTDHSALIIHSDAVSTIISALDNSNAGVTTQLTELFTSLKDVKFINLNQALNNLIKISTPSRVTVELKLSPEASEAGIHFVFYKTSIEGILSTLSNHRVESGLYLHVPTSATIPVDFPLAHASYITEAGIVAAAPTPLTINAPIKGKLFKPADSLCADYANTLGSDVYDVSGAVENGVDPRTGLFHAHYPVGVIRGLGWKGKEIDLHLHYSATRANESALGDGWAFRFSSYDNRMRRLTLSTGQTLTLTAENIEAARTGKTLRINGISLTDTKGSFDALTQITVIFPTGRREILAKPGTTDGKEASEHYKKAFVKKLDVIEQNLTQWLKEKGLTTKETDNFNKQLKEIAKLKQDMERTALVLIPSSITSPQGGTLALEWTGKQGHIQLNTIKDGSIVLLSAVHETPVASGEYGSTFTIWPGTHEEYSVKLTIKDCLLTQLTRQGKTDAAPTQTVVFGYCDEPVLDRVLNSVLEEDGSLETVSYASTWKSWSIEHDSTIPLSQVARHTLVPGAGQPAISHTWQFENINQWKQTNGSTCSSTQMLDNGDGVSGSFTRHTWTFKNSYWLLTETVEEVPDHSRTTTRKKYADDIQGDSLTAKYRLATEPVETTVTTEDLRPATQAATATAKSSQQESQS